MDDHVCDVDLRLGETPDKARKVHEARARYTKGSENLVVANVLRGLQEEGSGPTSPRVAAGYVNLPLESFLSCLRTVWTMGGGLVWKRS